MRRQVESSDLAEDGVPIVGASYTGNEHANTEGLRIYDAFFQHKSSHEIPKTRDDAAYNSRHINPILPHHRYIKHLNCRFTLCTWYFRLMTPFVEMGFLHLHLHNQ